MADEFQMALGLIETRGLVGAIEAADAMTKTSEVRLVRMERTNPALITVEIVGEVASVRSAVDAGRSAVERVGELVAAHVIPRPDGAVAHMLRLQDGAEETSSFAPAQAVAIPENLSDRTVPELRALARDLPDFPLQGREIAHARKQELIDHLEAVRDG